MKIKIEGIGGAEVTRETPVLKKVKEVLDAFPNGRLVTSNRLAELSGYTASNFSKHPELMTKYRVGFGGRGGSVWGNQKTIKQYRKEAGNAGR